jgi:hypothetical protein
MEPRSEPPAVPLTARLWVEALARHVQKRFDSRAVVTARTGFGEPLVLTHIQALEDGGLVLTAPCTHPQHATGATAEPGLEHPDHHDDREPCRGTELWLASPDQVVLEAREADEGELCTGFAYLGLSRTPHVLVQRGTEPPPHLGHHHGEF